jgi:hypothetical protein
MDLLEYLEMFDRCNGEPITSINFDVAIKISNKLEAHLVFLAILGSFKNI